MNIQSLAQKRAHLIRLIHIAKSQIHMQEAEYRALLANVSKGNTSSKDLTIAQLETVLQQMKAYGFQVSVKIAERERVFCDGQMQKLYQLWLELHELGAVKVPTEGALHTFCRRHGGEHWQDNHLVMSGLIERLKKWKARLE